MMQASLTPRCASRPLVGSAQFPMRVANILRDAAHGTPHRGTPQPSRPSAVATTKQHDLGALSAANGRPQPEARPSAGASSKGPSGSPPNGGGKDPDDETSTSGSFQIGLDPFSQQVFLSAITAGGAAAIAAIAHLDLSSCLRVEGESISLAVQLSTPVLLLLLAVLAPRWAPPFKGSELERLQHNYYMTAQVLQLYLDLDDEDGDGSGSGGSGSGEERARVQRRLRLEQTVGWGTISSGLALMQAFTLQPWNPPTANTVFGLGLAGRTLQQLANEYLVRGAGWGLISGWVLGTLAEADTSDGILFFGKVFGGPDATKYAAGLALVAAGLPGALWEARAARNFVRASIVGPVRDAAIFCTGNGVDEPAYCDPKGFAMMAARRPANAAPVADVVTRTRGWRSGPESSFTSVSSLASMDTADLTDLPDADVGTSASASPAAAAAAPSHTPPHDSRPDGPASAANRSESSSSGAPPPGSAPTKPSAPSGSTASAPPGDAASAPARASSSSPSSPSSPPAAPRAAAAAADANGASSSGTAGAGAGSGSGGAPSMPSAAPPAAAQPGVVGPTLSASSAAFEWDSEDMSVLLRVETLQDKIAFWSALYYQLLVSFAINGSFLASDCNLLASFAAAWLLRTGPLLLAELRARATADVAMRGA